MTSRRPFAKGFILELDGLRGIAILMVMVHRFWPRTGVGVAADVAGAGWIGVDLFFVISGFLIAGILLDTREDTGYFRNFYARRALRIFPLYYLFVIGVFVAFAGNPGFRDGAGSPFWYLVHLGNVPEGLLDNPVPYWLGPVWSLAIEEQFYLTFPWLVYFLDRRKLTYVLVAMIALAPAIRLGTMLALPDQERVQYLFTLCRVDTIAVGCLLAVIVRTVDIERCRESARLVAFCAIPSVVVLAIASGLERTSPFDRVFGYSLVAIGCVSVVALVILSRSSRATALLRWSPLTYLGKLCFGLYLLHRPADTFVSAAAARLGFEGDLRLLPMKLAVAVVLATISWRVLERPFLHLKDRFASARHPSAVELASSSRPSRLPAFVARALRTVGILIVLLAVSCNPASNVRDDDAGEDAHDDAGTTGGRRDARVDDGDIGGDAPGDASVPVDAGPPPPPQVVLYPEGARHSPIPMALVARLQSIAATSLQNGQVFAKVGDSISASTDFVRCFDNGSVDLAANGHLASTISYFAGSFARESLAARNGTTAADALAGNPCSLDAEIDAIDSRVAVVMFGTNEARFAWPPDEYGTHLWSLVDRTIARGVIPILSTIPPNTAQASANARVPTYNRVVRAIAQGRGVPLVDLHRELVALPSSGMSSDGVHPSVAANGGCILTSTGLQYGYNVRNLITLEVLARVRAALGGSAADASAATRIGAGSASDPFVGTLPLVDLADTAIGELVVTNHGCSGPVTSGHEVTYRTTLASSTSIEALVVDRPGVDVDVRIIVNGACIASGDGRATATVGPGAIDIVVDARTTTSDGEFLLVVQRP
jgi:peptidoglycan/LPS O-acetylase OafA/YrhL/lysophospholipase L1-like esterase